MESPVREVTPAASTVVWRVRGILLYAGQTPVIPMETTDEEAHSPSAAWAMGNLA